jgi:hypothetical protein
LPSFAAHHFKQNGENMAGWAGVTVHALAALALVGTAASIAGVSSGWATATKHADDGGHSPWAPKLSIELSIGWWNSTTHVTAGFVPAAAVKVSGAAARALGSVTACVLLMGCVVAANQLVASFTAAMTWRMPGPLCTTAPARYKLACLMGPLCIVFTLTLYLVLMFGAHSKIKDQTSQSVWPHPDWVSLAEVHNPEVHAHNYLNGTRCDATLSVGCVCCAAGFRVRAAGCRELDGVGKGAGAAWS